MFLNVLILFFVASYCDFGQTLDVKVSVYYESRCPDSINFINDQFWPAYKKIGSDIKVDLVAYGKASETNSSGKWEFTCQHGPRECFGNAYHACAIALYPKEESAEFVHCSMSSSDPTSEITLRECASNTGLKWASLKTCYESGQSDKLLVQNGERTRAVRPPITFIPTIILNDQFSEENQQKALYDFQTLICDALNQQPEACKDAIEVVYVA